MARRLTAPVAVAARRLVARPAAAALTGLGIALATAALTALLVSQRIVEDRAVGDAVAELPAEQRVLSVSWVGMGTARWAALDREARAALASLHRGEPVRAVSFRSTRLGTEIVRLTAVDDPAQVLTLRSGRLPARCGEPRCEVVALDGPPAPVAAPGIRVVGSAAGAPESPVGSLVGSTAAAERVLVAAGPEELAARPELQGLFRTLTWAVRLDADTLDSSWAAALPRRVAELETSLRAISPEFAIAAPLVEVEAARERARRASARQLLIGGQAIVVLFGFLVLAASRLRRGARETRFRLRRLGALRWQTSAEAVAYAVGVAVPSVAAGLVAGLAVGAVVAEAADRPAGAAVSDALSSPTTALSLGLLTLGALAVLVVVARAATIEVRGRGVTAVDVAAAAALAAIGALLLFGDTDAESLTRDDETGAALLLLPVLVAVAGALVAARLLPLAFRGGERIAARAGTAARIALLSLVRDPGATAVTVACLTVTVSVAVFALSYRATLAENQRDAAAYAAPLDYVVARDAARARLGDSTADLARSLGGGALPVIRRDGEAPTLNRTTELTVLGLPPDALRRMSWREDYASRSRERLAAAVRFSDSRLHGVTIPRGSRALVFTRELRGDPIRLQAQVRRPDGGFSVVELANREREVRAPLPTAAAGGTLVGLTLGFPPVAEATAAHRATGRRAAPDVFLAGALTLGPPRVETAAGTRALPVDFGDWVTSEGGATRGSRGRLTLRYLLTQERVFRVRPRQATDHEPIPVVASETIAAAAGTARVLPIRVAGAQLDVRIVATARRFPTLAGDFLVADRAALETAANASVPGSAVADEAWLENLPGRDASLVPDAPFPVRVISRDRIERNLRADPVARAASIALLAAALVAAVLALAALLLSLAVDARDDAAELFELETLGFDPAGLARHLRFRSAAVLGAGLLGGIAVGALASLLVTDVVRVTANATQPEPPLVLVVPWVQLAAALLALAVVGGALVAVLARLPFDAPAPARPEAA